MTAGAIPSALLVAAVALSAAAARAPLVDAFVLPSLRGDAGITIATCRRRPAIRKNDGVGARARPGRTSPTPASSDDEASSGGGRDMTSLQEWATSRGFQIADGVKLASEDGADWGISLHKSTPAGTPLMRVPKSIVLSSADAADGVLSETDVSIARSIIDECDMGEHWTEFLLTARILAERARGAKSEWRPWLESLPSEFTTGLFMDDVERSRLPALAAGLVALQDRQLEAFGQALRSVENDDIRAALAGPDGDNLIRWAFSVVFTRSHRFASEGSGDPRTEIVPMGDIFNHREPGDVVWNDDVNGGYAEFVLKEDLNLGEGEDSRDMYLSYGLSNPHRFLAIFGFVDEETPEVLSQVIFTNATPEMIELGCNDPQRMVFRSDGLIANAVWDSLLYAILSDKPEEQKALYEAHVDGNREAKAAVHSRYALDVAVALKRHVDQTLEGAYSEESTDIQSAGDPAEHPILPMVCRLNSLMRTVFTRVKLRLDGIVEQEYRRRMAETQQKR